jgi:nicotinamide-nucleotide amidase
MTPITAEIITIGDEILYGQTLDTNSHWICSQLDAVGISVKRKTTVADTVSDILTAFAEAESRVDIILITGGLGPTMDDLTKGCLVSYFNTDLVLNEEALVEIIVRFESRGRTLTQANKDQALLPRACEKITNTRGTAPGMWFHKNGKVFVSMPGVPYEMKEMMSLSIIPKLQTTFTLPIIYHKIIRTIGVGESWIADLIKPVEEALPSHIKLAYLPSVGQVKLRLTAFGNNLEQLKSDVMEVYSKLAPAIADYIYGEGDIEIEQALKPLLIEKQLTLATAESCTGGYLAHRITKIPGCSQYFKGGVVSYSKAIKTEQLGVKAEIIMKYGAVSEQTVIEMAEKVRLKYGTDIGLATTGTAGPSGGTAENPVGTVWIAYADKNKTVTKKLQLGDNRENVIMMAAMVVLELLRKQILLTKSTSENHIPNI